MGSHKSRDDEIYEQGVHDGQQAGALDQFSHSLVKGYSTNPRENEIYNRGYEYGVSHRPAAAKPDPAPERFRNRTVRNDTVSSSENSSGCGQVIAIIIGVGIAIAVALWLLANVVLPVGMLNSAVIFTILALVYKERKTLFSCLALAGAGYMLVDISNGWLSANFVSHVVHDASWLTGFVYLNAAAAGASTWILVVPLVMKASSEASQLKTRLLTGGAIAAIVAVAFIPPLVYVFTPNPFRAPPLESTTASATPTPGNEGPSLASVVPPPVPAGETASQFAGTWRRPKKEGMQTGYLGIAKRSDGTFTVASMSVVDGHFKAEGPPILVEGRRVGGAFSNVRFKKGHLYAKYRYHGIDSSWFEDYDMTLEGNQTIVCAIKGKEGKVVQLLHRED